MPFASIGPIATHFPQRVETNAQLQEENPNWNLPLLEEKVGIRQRHIAEPDETPADLAVAACQRLFQEQDVDPASIDFLLYCTQTPDYPLPTTACLLQNRLGLSRHCGALDFNLGCSGYVYGLAMADGLIRTGAASRILLITSETYSKYIQPDDRSLRPIFGDAAAVTLVESSDTPALSGFQFGTDGSGADTLFVTDGGARQCDVLQPRGRKRWGSRLYMDGPSLISFTVDAIPQLVDQVLDSVDQSRGDVDIFLMHQATRKMLQLLQARLNVDEAQLPIRLENIGNTVSSTLPILIDQLRRSGEVRPGQTNMLVGFGVGWSWGGCLWKTSDTQ